MALSRHLGAGFDQSVAQQGQSSEGMRRGTGGGVRMNRTLVRILYLQPVSARLEVFSSFQPVIVRVTYIDPVKKNLY